MTRQTPKSLRRAQLFAAGLLLTAWLLWWLQSYSDGVLWLGSRTWVPAMEALGFDFLHNYLGVRHWLAGGNPYLELFGDPTLIPYNYAPIVLGLFAWCNWTPLVPAVIAWSCAVGAIMAAAAWYSARLRQQLGVQPIAPIFAVALVLICSSVVFSMERGNCDVLVVVMLMVAVVAMKRTSATADAVAGTAIALATLIKVYPALSAIALLGLGRRRALLFTVVAGAVISLATPRMTLEWLHNIAADAARHHVPIVTHVHTISGAWWRLRESERWSWLSVIPPLVAAGIILVPLIAWVSLAVYRSPRRPLLAWPYLLWMTQVATFWSPVSYDYKLLFMPLAMVTLWERRSPWAAHVLLVPYLLYWQPMRIDFLGPVVLLVIKVAALFGSGILVQQAARARDHLGTPSISMPA